MKSIKEQRDIIDAAIIRHGVHTMRSTPEITALIEASANLLDWAERARDVLSDVDEFVRDSSIGAAASQLLEELPE